MLGTKFFVVKKNKIIQIGFMDIMNDEEDINANGKIQLSTY